MKSTGIVRKVDDLGRVVIPVELRRTLKISEGEALEIYVDSDRVIFKKYEPSCSCVFCGNADDTKIFRGKNICPDCYAELAK
jgi:transcriptional pleiotropic regulator of transition state genes